MLIIDVKYKKFCKIISHNIFNTVDSYNTILILFF